MSNANPSDPPVSAQTELDTVASARKQLEGAIVLLLQVQANYVDEFGRRTELAEHELTDALNAYEAAAERRGRDAERAEIARLRGEHASLLCSWREYDSCLQKITAACWTDNDPSNERDAAANAIRHIHDLQRRVKVVESALAASRLQSPTGENDGR